MFLVRKQSRPSLRHGGRAKAGSFNFQKVRKMKSQTIEDLERLVAFINDTHMGDYTSVSRDLYRAIYFLHYLEESTVGSVELHNTCFTLHSLAECFFKAHQDRRMRQYKAIKEAVEGMDRMLQDLQDDEHHEQH